MLKQIDIPTPDGTCDAWLAQPESGSPWPGVIFIPDAVGPREGLKEMAERLASNGYAVLLPNLFYRKRRAPIVTGIPFPASPQDVGKILEQIMPLVEEFDSSKCLQDIGVLLGFLKSLPQVRAKKFGVFGYCMGGAMAIRAAATYHDDFAAAASFHAGGLVSETDDSPHLLLSKIRAALYVGHADQDPHMTTEQIRIFDRAAQSMKTPCETELYPGAQHHFTMADLPAYDEKASKKHWQKLIHLFEAELS